MSNKLPPEVLLPIAAELFQSVGSNLLDKVHAASPGGKTASREEKLAARVDEFVKFYLLLRDRLQEDEE